MFDDMARAIADAALRRRKAAMIHFQVLTHADRLVGISPAEICKRVGIEEVWAAEVKKMMNLAELLNEEGLLIIGR